MIVMIGLSVWTYLILLIKSGGTFDVDLFATAHNAKCNVFYSKVEYTGTSGIDAFRITWKNNKFWIVPPPNLARRAINKIVKDETNCTLVIPQWFSAPFWPILSNLFDETFMKAKFNFSCKLV